MPRQKASLVGLPKLLRVVVVAMVVAYAGMALGIKNTHLLTKNTAAADACTHAFTPPTASMTQVKCNRLNNLGWWPGRRSCALSSLTIGFLCSLDFSVFFFRFLNEGLKCNCPRGSHVRRHQTRATQNEERLYHQGIQLNSHHVTPTPPQPTNHTSRQAETKGIHSP